jgi:hypothetical protein
MPTVLRWGPYRAFNYSNEGDGPAHVYVRAGSKEAKFGLRRGRALPCSLDF